MWMQYRTANQSAHKQSFITVKAWSSCCWIYSYSGMISFFIYFWNVKSVDGAAETRSLPTFRDNLSAPPLLKNSPEERSSHLLCGQSLKSCVELSRLLQYTAAYRLVYCYVLCSGSVAPDFSRDDPPKRREKLNQRHSGTSWNTWLSSATLRESRTPAPSTQHPAPIQLKASYGNAKFAGLRTLGLPIMVSSDCYNSRPSRII